MVKGPYSSLRKLEGVTMRSAGYRTCPCLIRAWADSSVWSVRRSGSPSVSLVYSLLTDSVSRSPSGFFNVSLVCDPCLLQVSLGVRIYFLPWQPKLKFLCVSLIVIILLLLFHPNTLQFTRLGTRLTNRGDWLLPRYWLQIITCCCPAVLHFCSSSALTPSHVT